jgi:hypothetical protein
MNTDQSEMFPVEGDSEAFFSRGILLGGGKQMKGDIYLTVGR